LAEGERNPEEDGSQASGQAIVIELAPGDIAEVVLARIVGILASRAGLGVDRVTEALALAEALGAHSREIAGDDHFRVVATANNGDLCLTIGPVATGDAARLLQLETHPALGSVIERLADRVEVADRGGEVLELHLSGTSKLGPTA